MKLLVLLPAYNEENTVGKVIKDIPQRINGIDTVEVLVVDDASTDSTSSKAKAAGARV